MSVFTTVSPEQLQPWLQQYAIGELVKLQGIASGIENTNYFVTTSQGSYVLTLFEKLTAAELPYYLGLMDHLAEHGLPCPGPVHRRDGALFGELNGKPASLVARLPGQSVLHPDAAQCAAIGAVLAGLHLAGQQYPSHMANPRGPHWWHTTAADIREFLNPEQQALLQHTLAEQAQHRFDQLPQGVIHADLFRDNALFDGAAVGGVIDFYFACNDVLLYDVAITVNDWCVASNGDIDPQRCHALLSAYHAVRPFSSSEAEAWPTLLRAGALRFWLSRLYDLHRPRAGELVHAKDPDHFYQMLRHHSTRSVGDLWL